MAKKIKGVAGTLLTKRGTRGLTKAVAIGGVASTIIGAMIGNGSSRLSLEPLSAELAKKAK
jgi:hypothetical protein